MLYSAFLINVTIQTDFTLQVLHSPIHTHIQTLVAGTTLQSATCLSASLTTHTLMVQQPEQCGARCLAQGPFDMLIAGFGFKPDTLQSLDNHSTI